ncbi:hypothetical protein L21SP2_2980 [Salinispira pacifica]|uniref:Uncharacterized protein n=1 Tax=Salinispira pacifica TaxID=1307761 RepID=V5WMF4_9SPIO|nr:hypothetical protein L21SP2_2980 [Salinispira pacifica]
MYKSATFPPVCPERFSIHPRAAPESRGRAMHICPPPLKKLS